MFVYNEGWSGGIWRASAEGGGGEYVCVTAKSSVRGRLRSREG